jgi:hypothetical protein
LALEEAMGNEISIATFKTPIIQINIRKIILPAVEIKEWPQRQILTIPFFLSVKVSR